MPTRLLASLPAIFIAFIAAGVTVIVTFSWSHRAAPAGAWHWTMIALVGGLMLVYGVVLWLRSRTAYASEGDGETFYYLGFIYTLATLVATFAPLLNAAERPDIRHVLGLFGLGLSTTFVGLVGRIVFANTSADAAKGPEDEAQRLGDAYSQAAEAIERSTVRIVQAQRRAEGHLTESYTGAVDAIRSLSARVTEQFESMSIQVLNQFGAVISRVSADAELTFTELRERAAREIESTSKHAARTHEVARQQIEELAAGTNGAVRSVTATLEQLETRLASLRLPPEDVGQRLLVILTELTDRAELLRRATASVAAAYGDLEGTLATAVEGAKDGGRAFSALAVSADAATTAVSSAKVNVEHFATQLTHVGHAASGLETLPREAAGIATALGTLRNSLTRANRSWATVADVTDGAAKSIARAGDALLTLEQGTRAAEQSILNWGGGLSKASVELEALTEVAERAVRLGQDVATTQAQLSEQIAGPLADQLRKHGEAAGALVDRLQEDLRASEDAVRKVHHHLIDASRFILSKVEYRR